jgi:hypothetical protein
MPEVRLDVVDAAELAELLQFLGGWLARDRTGSAPRWPATSATLPTAPRSCART